MAEATTPTPIERNAIAEYEITPAKVAEMAKEYMTLKVIEGDTASYKIVRAALTTVVTTRTGTDKHRKKLGEEARSWIKECNSAATQLLEPLVPVEFHLREELGKEDDRKAKIKAEKEEKELKRVSEIKEKIETIRSFSASLNWQLTSDELNVILGNLEVLAITPDEYMEFTTDAMQIMQEVKVAIMKAMGVREKFEEEEAVRKAEDERLAKERAEFEEQKKKAWQEAEDIRIAQEEEQAKIDAEKKRLEDEEFKRKAEAEAKEKAEGELKEKQKREAKEKEEKEKAEADEKVRMEAMKTDKRKLLDWLEGLQLTTLPPFVEDTALLSLSQDIGSEFAAVIKNAKQRIQEA